MCKYATDTGRPWCKCSWVACTEIECRNPQRLQALRERSDAASYHTKYDRQSEFVLVRSRFCNETHCCDFSAVEKTVAQ